MTTISDFGRRSLLVVALCASIASLCTPTSAAVTYENRTTTIGRYSTILRTFNPRMTLAWSRDLAGRVLLLSSYYGIDPRLLVAIVGVESSWRSDAISRTGAQGLGQLMPGTADGLAVRAFESLENLDGTARYLRRLLEKYASFGLERRYALAIASYNAGPAAVARWHGIPPFSETRVYVAHVMGLWHRLQSALPITGPVGPQLAARHTAHPRLALASRVVPEPAPLPPRSAEVFSGGLSLVGENADGPIFSDAPAARSQNR